jgi:hypothetical protein
MPRDTRPYITVTNELFRHPKFLRMSRSARLRILELWARCNEFKTDGYVDDGTWSEIPAKERKELTENGWIELRDGRRECHDYLKHQKSKKELEALKSNRSGAGTYGTHVQHHERKGIVKPGCPFCPEEPPIDEPDPTPSVASAW